VQLGAAEDAGCTGTDQIVAERGARCGGDAEEGVVLDAAAQGEVGAVSDVALDLHPVGVVGAFDGACGVAGGGGRAAFVFVPEATDGEEAELAERGQAIVRASFHEVAGGVVVGEVGIDVGVLEDGLAADRITVGAVDGDWSSEVVVEGAVGGVVLGDAGGGVVGVLVVEAETAVTELVVPAVGGLGVEDGAVVLVLLLDAGGVGNAVELGGVGVAAGGVDVAEGEADGCGGVGLVAQVPGEGGVVEGAGGDAVAGVQAGEVGEVVEAADGAAEDAFLAVGAEVAAFGRVLEERQGRRAAACGEADDAGEGVRAVEGGVGLAQDLDLGYPRRGDVGQLYVAADVVGGNAVDQDLVVVRVAAADVHAGCAAFLAGLGNLDAGNEAERLLDVEVVGELVGGQDGNGRGDLGQWDRGSGGGDGDGFGGGRCAQGDVGVICLAERDDGGDEGRCGGADRVLGLGWGLGWEMVLACAVGPGCGDNLAVAEEIYLGADDDGAERVADDSAYLMGGLGLAGESEGEQDRLA
jgi:hypothetical protein